MMYFTPIHKHPAYYKIEEQLRRMSLEKNPSTILKILQNFQAITSKQQYQYGYYQKGVRPYNVLLNCYRDQIPIIFNKISDFILKIPKQNLKIPILRSGQSNALNLQKADVVYLLCLMSLNLIPKQKYHQDFQLSSKFNRNNNFSFIFSSQEYKTRTIIEYFLKFFEQRRLYEKFLIRRQVSELKNKQQIFQLIKDSKMMDFDIKSNDQSIQQFYGSAKVDFANKYIGGGALTRGCVQEEITFANHPQMYISTVLCQSMKDNESITFVGFKKYFKNSGYSYSTKFDGFEQRIPYNINNGIAQQYFVCIDAVEFKNNSMIQFDQKLINRQIYKAYTGFNIKEPIDIVTGNWGCGAFNGDLKLKFMIQWIASSLARKKMIYCPYGKKSQLTQNQQFLQVLSNLTVTQVYQLLVLASERIQYREDNIIQFMERIHRKQQEIFKNLNNQNRVFSSSKNNQSSQNYSTYNKLEEYQEYYSCQDSTRENKSNTQVDQEFKDIPYEQDEKEFKQQSDHIEITSENRNFIQSNSIIQHSSSESQQYRLFQWSYADLVFPSYMKKCINYPLENNKQAINFNYLYEQMQSLQIEKPTTLKSDYEQQKQKPLEINEFTQKRSISSKYYIPDAEQQSIKSKRIAKPKRFIKHLKRTQKSRAKRLRKQAFKLEDQHPLVTSQNMTIQQNS